MKFYGARLPLAFALIVLSVCSAQASRNNIRHCAGRLSQVLQPVGP